MLVARGNLGHRCHQLTQPTAILVGRDAEVGAPGDVPHREREPGLEDLVGHLGRVEGGLEGKGLLLLVAEAPPGRSPRFFSWRRVSSASAPVITAPSHSPRITAAAASCTSTWGVVPPMPE